ncbi:hypothetical protein [Brevifollis gellanilyticus]|uniref:hypothetical protein n=1 Tax=Brevifollis gellanilyticus TaxID=748831 RepID=UPI0011BFAE7F|nr:hypothetical protein [Brevifollis gellanilyticus]
MFEGRNVLRLFNAFTESLQSENLAELPKQTEALHDHVDSHVRLAAGEAKIFFSEEDLCFGSLLDCRVSTVKQRWIVSG